MPTPLHVLGTTGCLEHSSEQDRLQDHLPHGMRQRMTKQATIMLDTKSLQKIKEYKGLGSDRTKAGLESQEMSFWGGNI